MNVNELQIAVAETAGTEIVVTDAATLCLFSKALAFRKIKSTDFCFHARFSIF